jgi:hypothetical protein
VTSSLAFDFVTPQLWRHVAIEYPPARELAMRHYPQLKRPRKNKTAPGVLAPGERFLLWHDGACGKNAAWGVVRNRFRSQWFFRNSLFRNESKTLSSELIREATRQTFMLWKRRYLALPDEPLITEVDIEATRSRRGKSRPPGYCYLMAGWIHVTDLAPGHGRPPRAIFRAPSLSDLFTPAEAACLA